MSRRLEQMSEESLENGGQAARAALGEAGFDEDLRRRLEERVAGATFRSDNASAFAEADLPAGAGKATRDLATAQPWTGTETIEDASLRMLTDARKPLRPALRSAGARGQPIRVDVGRASKKLATGERLVNARDRSSVYSAMKDSSVSEKEREQFRRQMTERFQPQASAVLATPQGLANLANKKYDDAVSRGLFKNLPRGKKLERDYNASSPFLDTTEYFLNKIIQKQEIVPPWIEKQQELVAAANRFRARLRSDWKRHAARTIASQGGSLNEQVQKAEAYAFAERAAKPAQERPVRVTDGDGHLSQISLAGELEITSEVSASVLEKGIATGAGLQEALDTSDGLHGHTVSSDGPSSQSTLPDVAEAGGPTLSPFRDPTWEATERSYLELSIKHLNQTTRTYNLLAPDLAKKPYFNLARELRNCYADVAPLLASEIVERARSPKVKDLGLAAHQSHGVMQRFGVGSKVMVRDEKSERRYGFKEFWRDLLAK